MQAEQLQKPGMEMTDYLFARHHIYDLLRRLFIEEPTPELLSFVRDEQDTWLIDSIDALDRDVRTGLARIGDALSGRSLSPGASDYEDLHWDFTRLFIGPETPPAPPWESCYVGEGLLFQEATRSVEQYYRDNGFVLSGNEYEAADHIGFELDFIFCMSGLALRSADAPDAFQIDVDRLLASVNVQLDFIRRHLFVFVDEFGRKVSRNAGTQYYKEVGLFLPIFVKSDERRLSRLA